MFGVVGRQRDECLVQFPEPVVGFGHGLRCAHEGLDDSNRLFEMRVTRLSAFESVGQELFVLPGTDGDHHPTV